MSYSIYVLLSHLANQTLTTVSVGLYYIAVIEVHNSIFIPQVKPLGEHPVSTAKEHDV